MSDHLHDDTLLQSLIKENSTVLNDIRNRAGKLPRTAVVEFGCEMPDKSSALAARQELITQLPNLEDDAQIYTMSTDGEIECRIDTEMEISAKAISMIEIVIQVICQEHGGGEVFWGFERE